MLDAAVGSVDLSKLVLAIGGLGTAAYGVVDATKAFGGGVSRVGFGDIKKVISKLIPPPSGANGSTSALALDSALATLRANWMNGMATGDQKSIAKALVKLNLTSESAGRLAAATGVDSKLLANVATKLSTKDKLADEETDVYGRFDLALSALLDQAYQRGDQRYRNTAKLLAVVVSVLLAWAGASTVLGSGHLRLATLAGLLATPLAPVAKDLSSAIQAGAKVAQFWKA
jgi:hypothetical protein